VTTAETLRAEGFAEGRAEGFAEGVAEVLVHMLTTNVHPVPENVAGAVHKTVRQAVRDMSVDELKVWMARTAAAKTPGEMDEIFGWPPAACPEPRPGAGESPVADREEASREG
jgi:hypothetical protein